MTENTRSGGRVWSALGLVRQSLLRMVWGQRRRLVGPMAFEAALPAGVFVDPGVFDSTGHRRSRPAYRSQQYKNSNNNHQKPDEIDIFPVHKGRAFTTHIAASLFKWRI